jgi:glycosyltransferase involved in cell wall biosynthesis
MASAPILSIITVVRNDPVGLAATIRSVRAQTYPGIEFVVVDGASTDGTSELVRGNACVIDKWVSEPDKGLYDGMNKGKSMASGDFVMFVNAGDTFVSDRAIEQMMACVKNLDTLYFGKVLLTDCTGTLSWDVPLMGRNSHTPPKSYLPHHQSIFYPRPFFALHDYDLRMGYRADAHYTDTACRILHREFTNVLLIQSTLGGLSSRLITSVAELRKEIALETALARHIAASTGDYVQLIDVGIGPVVKYLASKAGGLPLVHRLMYMKHRMRRWVASIRGE